MCSCNLNNAKPIQSYSLEINTQERDKDLKQTLTYQHLDQDDFILNGKSFNLDRSENISYSQAYAKCQIKSELRERELSRESYLSNIYNKFDRENLPTNLSLEREKPKNLNF